MKTQQSEHTVKAESVEHFLSPPEFLILLLMSIKKYFLNLCYYSCSFSKKAISCRPENTYFDSCVRLFINRRENKLVGLLGILVFSQLASPYLVSKVDEI